MATMLQQFHDLKSKHPTAVLLFRCGDFYESYEDDAKVCAKVLGITLTEHRDGYRMAGFPHHALDVYLPKLIRAGKRVAICDQLEDPKLTKKLVKRGITELVTPATNNNDNDNPQNQTTMRLSIAKNQNNESANVQPAAQVINPTAPMAPAVEDADAVEIKDEQPAPAPAAKADNGRKKPVTNNRKVAPKKKEAPKAAAPAAEHKASALPHVKLVTYTTKKGGTAPQIVGFADENDPRWRPVFEMKPKWASASYRRDLEGNKMYIMLFGTRYMDAAKALVDAYNTADKMAWHKAEEACQAVYEQAVADGKAAREEKKAERVAAKAEDKKSYSPEEVAAMLESVASGGTVPENVRKHIKRQAA